MVRRMRAFAVPNEMNRCGVSVVEVAVAFTSLLVATLS